MSNGYKPAPLDLSDVKLTASQEVLVDKLAENAHNVWAKDRIKQGWTYGIQQVNAFFSVHHYMWAKKKRVSLSTLNEPKQHFTLIFSPFFCGRI